MDRENVLREIEELLGGTGSREWALALLPILEEDGYVTRGPEEYVIDIPDFNDDGATWNRLVERAERTLDVQLTNGNEVFTLRSITEDKNGLHGTDIHGSVYTKCSIACEHEFAPAGAIVWHDDAHTEELWEVQQ